MIPKIIHYCWLSNDPIPSKMQTYMDSWKEMLPEYEFVLWDTRRFDVNSIPWVSEAFKVRKYAFAADYIRLYAVYHYGGIYMDMDVEVVKPFSSELLASNYLVGYESSDTYTIHHFEGSWFTLSQRIKKIIIRLLGVNVMSLVRKLFFSK